MITKERIDEMAMDYLERASLTLSRYQARQRDKRLFCHKNKTTVGEMGICRNVGCGK